MSERALQIDGKAATLVSSYHQISSFSTKYVFEEADGTTAAETLEDVSDANPDVHQPRRRPRFLAPRECCRLMGFPESFVIPSHTDERGTALFYKQIGNAVCPPIISSIGAEMLRQLAF
eukprot:SAG31_NODE_3736_length_3944_cov_1.151120_1_plen_119_part_00